jgi:ATP-binding cassette subfamily B protein
MKTVQYFWEMIRFRPRYYLLDLTGATIHFALSTVLGLILRAFFNGLSDETGTVLTAAAAAGWLLLQTAVVLLTLTIAVLAYVNFTQHNMALLIRNMIARILELPGSAALPMQEDGQHMSTGQVISTLRDDTNEMAHAIIIIDDLVALSVTAVIALAIMLRINIVITLGTFLPLALIIFVANRLGNLAETYRRRSRAATSTVTGLIADLFNNTQAVKVAGAEERLIRRFRALNDQRQETMVRDRVLTQIIDALSSSTVEVGMGLILLFAARAMYAGEFTVGDFALFAANIWPATQVMRTAGYLITRYRQVGVSTQRMEAIMQGAPTGSIVAHQPIHLTGAPPVVPAVKKSAADRLHQLTVRNLTYFYPHSDRGIAGINFTLSRGTFTAITGRIGSGKSTLLQVLLGLLPAQSGEILWNNVPVTDLRTFMTPPRVAYNAQVPLLFSATLQDNLLLGQSAPEAVLKEALQTAVFLPDLQEMEQGLQTRVGPKGVRLSGGQVQRAAAARMLLHDAELLLIDDLSSALDVTTEQQLWRSLRAQQAETTLLVVSHRRAALQHADHILLLENGRIDDQGTVSELLARSAKCAVCGKGKVARRPLRIKSRASACRWKQVVRTTAVPGNRNGSRGEA